MGLMYFFPGAWKVAGSWPHWFSSQNMESLLYRRMLELQPTQLQWSALHFPFGLVLSTYAAVFFELSMIFLILQERLRPLAFIMGLTFHNLTRLLMAIPFLALQFCYAALLDWTMLLRLIGTRLGPRILTVIYDPQCKLCRRTIAVLCNLDWLDLLDLLPNTRLEGLKPAETAFAVLSFDGTLLPGYDGYQLIASRIVPLWPVRLLMTLPLVNRIGKAIYRRGAFLRNRDIAGQTGQANMQRTPFITPGARAFSVFTICTMFLFGVAHGVNCWPLACYPTFDGPFSLSVKKLTLETVSKSGRVANYTLSYDQQMGYLFGTGRWDGLVQQQFRRQRVTKASSAALVRLWLDQRRVHECAVATLFEDNYALQLPTLTLKFEGRNQLAAFSTSDGI